MMVRVFPGALLARASLLFALVPGFVSSGCGDGDRSATQLERDAESAATPDEASAEPDTREAGAEPAVAPTPVQVPPDDTDAGDVTRAGDGAVERSDGALGSSDAGSEDAGLDAARDLDASDADLADAGELDASSAGDGGADVGPSSAPGACPDGGQRDACGVCGGATSCHPLFGRYAARAQLFARQRSQIIDGANILPIDAVSKVVLLSVVDIDAQGRAKEHYCLLELAGSFVIDDTPAEIASWLKPSAGQAIPDTTLPLTLDGGRYVRARDAHKAYYGWIPDGCSTSTALPASASDCRVRDTDQDTIRGGAMFLGLGSKPSDPESESEMLQLNVAAQLGFGWSLPASAAAKLVGGLSGGFQLTELSRSGSLKDLIGQVSNVACPENLGHIELVRDDVTTCAAILAGRVADAESAGLFDVTLDAPTPQPSACVDPACAQDTDRDGTPNCNDGCPADPGKVAAGACGCGVADTNTDGDALPNCADGCPSDAAKTAPGACGCGVADTNSDGDSLPNCSDRCPNDAAKTAPGICGCGVADTNTDGDTQADCQEQCDSDPNKLQPGTCGCGVRDADLNGDGTIDCSDSCPNDPAKVAPGLCGCGVADTNTDSDALPDCTDQCDNNPNLTVSGACGCDACPTSPLVGTFAVRAAVFGKQRNGSEVVSSKSLNYSLVTISENSDRTLRFSEQACWTQSLPNPNESGTKVYSWSKPAWLQAIPASVQNLVANSNGTYTRTIPATRFGWDPARQPASCSSTSTPAAPWPSAWGSTCQCNTPASSLPPYDTDAAPYDCRLVDVDGDGQPGLSAIAGTAAPSSPDANAPALGGTAFAATINSGAWLITARSTGNHTATISDTSVAQLVGCTGLACSQLASTPGLSVACPRSLNLAQFVRATSSSDSCSEIIAARNTLFAQDQDPAWPNATACPPP